MVYRELLYHSLVLNPIYNLEGQQRNSLVMRAFAETFDSIVERLSVRCQAIARSGFLWNCCSFIRWAINTDCTG